MDALSDVLAAVRLSGAAFLDAELTAPWCIAAQVGPEDCRPLGMAPGHVIAYHYIADGRMSLEVSGIVEEVRAGEIVLLPRNDRHILGSVAGLTPAAIDGFIQPRTGAAPASLRYGGGGETTRVICGFIGCEAPGNPLLATLPPVLRLGVSDGAGGEWIQASFHRAAEEFAEGGVGSATVLGKLAELLFVEAVRRYLASLPAQQTGWLAGLRDRIVGRALGLLHARVADPWTTEELARRVGLSRSALAERFTTLLGMPPMRYLAAWRLQLAAARLRDSPRSTAQIASEVGYESEAAFSRAFKRAFGVTPAAWRRQSGE